MELGKKQLKLIVGGIVILWILSWIFIDLFFYLWTPECISTVDRHSMMGTFGDKFGAINSLFSGLALAGIIISIILQRQELKETRQEFKDQNFQTTFFNLLKTQQSITQDIICEIKIIDETANPGSIKLKGRSFFEQAKKELEHLSWGITHPKYAALEDGNEIDFEYTFGNETERNSKLREKRKQFALKEYGITNAEKWEKLNKLHRSEIGLKAYDLFFEKNQFVIGHYFRHLYHILSFLSLEKKDRINQASEKDIPEIGKEMNKFSDFIQAQLSTYELFLLFYNSQNYDKLQKYMMEFDFYKHIPDDALIFDENRVLLEKLRAGSKVKK